MKFRVLAYICLSFVLTSGLTGQRRGGGPDVQAPRPIAAFDSVWIEELTWMEVRDAIKAGKTTAIIPAGSTEQNGPYVPTGKHVYVLRATSEAIARKLGNALIAPTVPFEPGAFSQSPGTIQVRQETFEAFVEDEANSLKANGFKHVVLIGDSGGDQRGLDNVAKKLTTAWAGSGTSIHYIKEYYDSWQAADGAWGDLGIPKTGNDGIHDDYSVNSIIATLDPEKIRYKERVAAKKDSINGQPISPIERTVINGKKLVEIRANIAVDAIKKAIASSSN
jgi:creatinine amidohydrolase/Fe(II)-dependent formamide hydrolase-like protein